MQRQLISQDIHLLKEIAELGDVSPKVFDQNHGLESSNWKATSRQCVTTRSGWMRVYRLTLKGRAIASRW